MPNNFRQPEKSRLRNLLFNDMECLFSQRPDNMDFPDRSLTVTFPSPIAEDHASIAIIQNGGTYRAGIDGNQLIISVPRHHDKAAAYNALTAHIRACAQSSGPPSVEEVAFTR